MFVLYEVVSNMYVFHLWYLHSLKHREENWWGIHSANKFDTFWKKLCGLYFYLKFSNIISKQIICTFHVSKLWPKWSNHLGKSMDTPGIKLFLIFMTVPCPRPSVIFQELYQVILASIIAVVCCLTDFTLCRLLSAHQTILKYVDCFLSYKNVPTMSTVRNQRSVVVIPVNEINFSVCLPMESTLALPRDLFWRDILAKVWENVSVLTTIFTSRTVLKLN